MLTIWTLYRRPTDLPQFEVVARKWVVDSKGHRATYEAYGFDTLEEARARMEAMGLYCMPRDPTDDPIIIETWL